MSYGRTYGGGGGNRFGGGSSFGGPKPVETGKEYDVQVTETSRQGDGIARVQGFVIFVKNAKVGQKAKIKVTNVGARFATAELVSAASAASSSSAATTATTPSSSTEEAEPKESQAPQE